MNRQPSDRLIYAATDEVEACVDIASEFMLRGKGRAGLRRAARFDRLSAGQPLPGPDVRR